MTQRSSKQVSGPTATAPVQAAETGDCLGRISPALMILGAWLAGTLLFELTTLDEIGSQSAGEHWGRRAATAQQWAERETEFAVLHRDLDRFDQVAKPISQSRPATAERQSNGQVATAAPAVKSAAAAAVQLSSHQSPQRRGFTIPRMIRQAATTTDQTANAAADR